MKGLIHSQIQGQMEMAVECLNSDEPLPAQRHFEECARLCRALFLEEKLLEEEKPKQITLHIDC